MSPLRTSWLPERTCLVLSQPPARLPAEGPAVPSTRCLWATCQIGGAVQMSWRLPCPAGRAEERTEVGGRQAARTGVARRRRSKGGLVDSCTFLLSCASPSLPRFPQANAWSPLYSVDGGVAVPPYRLWLPGRVWGLCLGPSVAKVAPCFRFQG
uniref:Uncharacterized protein n=1 Tax=Ursus maritimus TaxID=29073 RepID=A0A452UWC6_URSMA